jgi:hypothetical protein
VIHCDGVVVVANRFDELEYVKGYSQWKEDRFFRVGGFWQALNMPSKMKRKK